MTLSTELSLATMVSRVESAAQTRRALIDAAGELLDEGGPEAVTVREVGTRAGVSRGAPYRHFADKEGLLTAIVVENWDRTADVVRSIGALDSAPGVRLQKVLMAFVELGRERPHLYRQMFVISKTDPGAGARAALGALDEFLSIVAELVGEADAPHVGALLFSGAHGITELEISGHLTEEKWRTSAEDLIASLVAMTGDHYLPTRPRSAASPNDGLA